MRPVRNLVFLEGGLGLGVEPPGRCPRQFIQRAFGLGERLYEFDAVQPEALERV
jgi:hypothetical protein